MKPLIAFLVIFISMGCYTYCQTKIVTKTGNTIIGFINDDNDSEIIMTTINNEKLSFPKNSIDSRTLIKIDLKLKSGSYLIGTFTGIRDKDFDFLTMDGAKTTISFENVEYFYYLPSALEEIINNKIPGHIKIKSEERKPDDYQLNENHHERPESKKNYKKIGLAYGTPGGINLIYGYSNRFLCFNLSSGLWDDSYGFQLGAGVDLFSNKNIEINLMFIYGRTHRYDTSELIYYGVGPDLNIYGFHLQGGFAFRENPHITKDGFLQIGYAYRFND
ncbi:MAG: hypothetical protein RO257_02150 [Candidatus Kapabacteria bacterium]|nr:hypothetical protein [Candidatus Kapabacteria bacterium]